MLRADAPVFVPRWNKDNKGADWKEAWSRLRRAVESVPGLHVREMHVFGSMQIGLGLESADVDVTVIVGRRMNNELNFPPNFERLVLGCIDADFCK